MYCAILPINVRIDTIYLLGLCNFTILSNICHHDLFESVKTSHQIKYYHAQIILKLLNIINTHASSKYNFQNIYKTIYSKHLHVTAHSREPCVHSMVSHPIECAVVPNSQEHTDTSKFTIQLIPSEFITQCQILTNYIYTL